MFVFIQNLASDNIQIDEIEFLYEYIQSLIDGDGLKKFIYFNASSLVYSSLITPENELTLKLRIINNYILNSEFASLYFKENIKSIVVEPFFLHNEGEQVSKPRGRLAKSISDLMKTTSTLFNLMEDIYKHSQVNNGIIYSMKFISELSRLRNLVLLANSKINKCVDKGQNSIIISESIELSSCLDLWMQKELIYLSSNKKFENKNININIGLLDKEKSLRSSIRTIAEPSLINVGFSPNEVYANLPINITVVSVSVDFESETLYVIRYNRESSIDQGSGVINCQPAVYRLPLKLPYEDIEKINEIIEKADYSISSDGITAITKADWWSNRADLDLKFKTILRSIQEKWFGLFIGLLYPKIKLKNLNFEIFRREVSIAVYESIPKSHKSKKKLENMEISLSVVQTMLAFVYSSTKENSDEQIYEDTVGSISIFLLTSSVREAGNFSVDKAEFSDKVYDSLNERLKEIFNEYLNDMFICEQEHVILVLDKQLSNIPIESFPYLRGFPISRVPSMELLLRISKLSTEETRGIASFNQFKSGNRLPEMSDTSRERYDEYCYDESFSDLIQGAKNPGYLTPVRINRGDEDDLISNDFSQLSVKKNNKSLIELQSISVDQNNRVPIKTVLDVDVNSVFYLINPGGDLQRTQQIMEPIIKMDQCREWSGIIGREPLSQELVYGLHNSEIYLYFGHGGGEKYLKRSHLSSIGLLKMGAIFGCSSGKIFSNSGYSKDQFMTLKGIGLDGNGVNYLASGSCSSYIGNLFDVGDKDIDTFSLGFLRKFGMVRNENEIKESYKCACCFVFGEKKISNVQAVSMSRDECKMKYLTGCAPVVYGLPVYSKN
ncbi:Separin [Smittium culicis]|uniref:separase n=1 Tax=Smittium culicis TaxID=133412 RepID=A0A1R1YTV5_9FUNG|nr:Separin [Smittium culicis]